MAYIWRIYFQSCLSNFHFLPLLIAKKGKKYTVDVNSLVGNYLAYHFPHPMVSALLSASYQIIPQEYHSQAGSTTLAQLLTEIDCG